MNNERFMVGLLHFYMYNASVTQRNTTQFKQYTLKSTKKITP